MNAIMISLCIFSYVFVGVIVDSAIKEDWEKPSILVIILFPIILVGIVIFKILDIAVTVGEKFNRFF